METAPGGAANDWSETPLNHHVDSSVGRDGLTADVARTGLAAAGLSAGARVGAVAAARLAAAVPLPLLRQVGGVAASARAGIEHVDVEPLDLDVLLGQSLAQDEHVL